MCTRKFFVSQYFAAEFLAKTPSDFLKSLKPTRAFASQNLGGAPFLRYGSA